MIKRFIEVVPSKLYRGSAPSPLDVQWLKDNLNINKIVSLDEATGEKIDRPCKLLGIDHVKLYIGMDRKGLLNFLTHDLAKLFMSGTPTFVHCHEGKDRTGMAIGLFKCQYMGAKPDDAIAEAKSLGFGIGIDPKITKLYEKVIHNSNLLKNKNKDSNEADIVSNQRVYKGDNRDGFLDEVLQGSFAPYLDHTRQNPMDALYTYIDDQSPTRQNYPDTSLFQYDPSKGDAIPNVGEYDNDAGQRGFGPVEQMDGFFSEVGH